MTYEMIAGYLRGFGISMVPAVLTMLGVCGVRIVWVYTAFAANRTFDTLLLAYPLSLAVTAALMIALTLFIDKTKLGKAMRAVSEDKNAATLMGISVDRTITLTFAIGSALAAFASMFYGMTYVYIKPTTGAMPGIKAFTAAVFGGIGSIPGAMLGGILLGLIEQLSKTYISTLWADAIVFAVLVVVLVVKPTGLLGKPMQEKV